MDETSDIIWFNDKHPNNSVVKASEVINHVANHCYGNPYRGSHYRKDAF